MYVRILAATEPFYNSFDYQLTSHMATPSNRHRVNCNNFVTAWLHSTPGPTYTSFACTLLSELSKSRPTVERALAQAVFIHHNDPATYRKNLAHLGYPATAEAIDRRPKSMKTRLGNFGEVLASEFLRQVRGYRIPVYRLRYNCNDESSPKGDDVLAFEFSDKTRGVKDTVIVAEVKVRSKFQSNAVEDAHDALRKGHRPRPKSFMFVVDVLFKEGKDEEAKRLLDLSHKFGKRSLVRKSVLFLVTGNKPRAPFDTLSAKKRLAPNLEAVHLQLSRLGNLVNSTFETAIDVHSL
jgi:hypothetical protein